MIAMEEMALVDKSVIVLVFRAIKGLSPDFQTQKHDSMHMHLFCPPRGTNCSGHNPSPTANCWVLLGGCDIFLPFTNKVLTFSGGGSMVPLAAKKNTPLPGNDFSLCLSHPWIDLISHLSFFLILIPSIGILDC
jgi:hypothetical protein